ncbi:hypothetical protein VNO78_36383 [Psophocarpus tetragonolobus]|uniref:Uncharacterized protein n=1 Tax=Psophocarpus tetragonolobus TaxID=3891 RepID=A0AAN9RHE9_PSOTE
MSRLFFLRVFGWLSGDRLRETISIHTGEVLSRALLYWAEVILSLLEEQERKRHPFRCLLPLHLEDLTLMIFGSVPSGALIARSGTNLWVYLLLSQQALVPDQQGHLLELRLDMRTKECWHWKGIGLYDGKDTGRSCAFPTLARKRCETRFFNHYFSSTLNSVLSGSRSGGSLFAVAGATGGSGSRLRTSESFDPKHQNIDH